MKHRVASTVAAASIALVGAFAALAQNDDAGDTRDENLAERRQEILEMARETIADLRADESARRLIEEAYGYAVFDTTKGGLLVTGAGGTGVAQRTNGRDAVFMHMGAGGVGLGAGIENYKLVLLFENDETFKAFVDGDWEAGVSAQAAAGSEGAAAVGRFVNGVAVYHITDKGVIAQVDISGARFWPSDRLNPGIG
jgi:lipid-binding SYLF domain-containing protein